MGKLDAPRLGPIYVAAQVPSARTGAPRIGAPVHALRIDRVRIGTRYNGRPIISRYHRPMALCGSAGPVPLAREDRETITTPTCASCARIMRKQGIDHLTTPDEETTTP